MEGVQMPQKKYFRQRAHCNPLSHNDSFVYPNHPLDYDWSMHYPSFVKLNITNNNAPVSSGTKRSVTDQPIGEGDESTAIMEAANRTADDSRRVEMIDIGCGYGGLSISLAKMFPEKLILALEIRTKVSDFVKQKIMHLREKHPGEIRISKRKIIEDELLEYAYILAPGGRLYTITDVKDLADWHFKHMNDHPMFKVISETELANDVCVTAIRETTEEGKKVERNAGAKIVHVFQRI